MTELDFELIATYGRCATCGAPRDARRRSDSAAGIETVTVDLVCTKDERHAIR